MSLLCALGALNCAGETDGDVLIMEQSDELVLADLRDMAGEGGRGPVVTAGGGSDADSGPVIEPGALDSFAATELLRALGSLPADVPLPSIPRPTLEPFDPGLYSATGGPVEQAWRFRLDGERPMDVFVALDGSAVRGVVWRSPYESSLAMLTNPLFQIDPITGVPNFVAFNPPLAMGATEPVEVAYRFFETFRAMFGTGEPRQQLIVTGVDSDLDGDVHVTLSQLVASLPVWGAELRVHLNASLAITSIAGRYYRDPEVNVHPRISEAEASQSVRLLCAEAGGDRTGSNIVAQGLAILPLRFVTPAADNLLVYGFSCGELLHFASAETGSVVLTVPLDAWAREVRDHESHWDYESAGPLQLRDGVELVPITLLDPEARAADNGMAATEAFWTLFGWRGFDGRSGNQIAWVNVNFFHENEAVEVNAKWSPRCNCALFSRGLVVPDLVSHELMHGVTASTAKLVYLGESGATSESFSDVMAKLINAATLSDWRLAIAGRDLASPEVDRYSEYRSSPLDAANDYGAVHTNSTILSHAAVLLSDGDGGLHRGIRRPQLARLWWKVHTSRLTPWSTFLDVAVNAWQVGRELAERGQTGVPLNGNPPQQFDPSVVAEVLWAFGQVEIEPRLIAGWFSVPSNQTQTLTYFADQPPLLGEVVSDVYVRVAKRRPRDNSELFEGVLRVSTGALSGTFASGKVSASIDRHGVGTASRAVTVTTTTADFSDVEVSPQVATTPLTPTVPPTQPAATPGVTHWFDNPFFAGRRYGDTLFEGVTLPNNCRLDDVQLELIDRDGVVHARNRLNEPAATWAGTGAYIVVSNIGTSQLTTSVRSWHEFGKSVRYRVVYSVTGFNCALPPFTVVEVDPNSVP
jgi:hypothetical protein